MAGRRPTPTARKIAAGNPGKRAPNPDEPQPAASRLTVPKYLKDDKLAAAEFKRMGKLLLDLGVMTEVDETALSAYCSAYSSWITEDALIRKEGSILRGPNGRYANPRQWIRDRSFDKMVKLLAEFGMTPSSRSRIKAAPAAIRAGKGMVDDVLAQMDPASLAAAAKLWEPPAPAAAGKETA